MGKCIIEWCIYKTSKIKKWMCNTHYIRHLRWKDINKKTRYDKRPCILEWDIAKIPIWLDAKDWYAIVDSKFSFLSEYNRCGHWPKKYACRREPNTWKVIFMHHEVLPYSKWLHVDHIDWNVRNNTEANLRSVEPLLNNINRSSLNKNNTSWHRWIHYEKSKNLYRASISHKGKTVNWWRFKTIDEAIECRKLLEKKYFTMHNEF